MEVTIVWGIDAVVVVVACIGFDNPLPAVAIASTAVVGLGMSDRRRSADFNPLT